MRITGLVLALGLAGCGQAPDGYKFDGAEFDRKEQTIKVVSYESLAALRRAAPDEARKEGRDLHAFGLVYPTRCEIHVAPLNKSESRMWLGHELTHCVHGRWHK